MRTMGIMNSLGALLAAACFAAYAGAPQYQPYPLANITVRQWEEYHQAVATTYGSTRRIFPDEHLEVFDGTNMSFAFTTAGHPAHPAWIARQTVSGGVNQIGYFAGEEEPYTDLFRAYLALTDKTLKGLSDEKPPSALAAAADLRSSFSAAKRIWEQSSVRKDYQSYVVEFSQFNNYFHLDEKAGCHTLGKEPVEIMLLITHRAGQQYADIENVYSSVDSAKARCLEKTYRGLKTKVPPFLPFVLQIGTG